MAAPKGKAKGFEKILFPTDFSEASERAAGYALMLARQNKARLFVVHVVDTSVEAAGFYLPHLSFEGLDNEMRAGAVELLEKFTAKNLKGYNNIEGQVLSGEPYRELLKVMKSSGIDLVVMGSSGKARMDRVMFGSTTERVMRKAACPVLVIPPSK